MKNSFGKKYGWQVYICFSAAEYVLPTFARTIIRRIKFRKPNLPCRDLNPGPLAHESNTLPLSYGSSIMQGEENLNT